MSKTEENKIINKLAVHYKIVEKMGYIVVGAFLYGPQNYTFTLKEKDTHRVRSKVLVIPSISNLLDRSAYEIQEFDEGDDTIEILDVNTMLNAWKNGNLQMMEILYTDYASINPQYAAAVFDLKKLNASITEMNPNGFITSCKNIAQSLLSDIELPISSPKDRRHIGESLYEAYRINSILQDFLEKGHTFQQALYEVPEWLKGLMELTDADGTPMSDEEILQKAKRCNDLISVRIDTLSADTTLEAPEHSAETNRHITQTCSELIEAGLMNKLSGNNEQLNLINKNYSSALKELDKNHKQISELKLKHQADLTQKDEEWKNVIRKQEEDFKHRLTDKDALLDDVRHGYISQITEIKDHHKQEILRMGEMIEKQVRSELNGDITQLNDQIAELKESLTAERESLKRSRNDYQVSILELEQKHESLLKERSEIYDKELKEKEASFNKKLSDNEREHQRVIEGLQKKYEKLLEHAEKSKNENLQLIEQLKKERLPEHVIELQSQLQEAMMIREQMNEELMTAEERVKELELAASKKKKHFWQY